MIRYTSELFTVNTVKKKASLPYGRDAFSRLSGAMLDDLAH
ncbi:hypothetical protein WCP94_002618 [Bilophila wadsworthia]